MTPNARDGKRRHYEWYASEITHLIKTYSGVSTPAPWLVSSDMSPPDNGWLIRPEFIGYGDARKAEAALKYFSLGEFVSTEIINNPSNTNNTASSRVVWKLCSMNRRQNNVCGNTWGYRRDLDFAMNELKSDRGRSFLQVAKRDNTLTERRRW